MSVAKLVNILQEFFAVAHVFAAEVEELWRTPVSDRFA
jgi:hypothetical protein